MDPPHDGRVGQIQTTFFHRFDLISLAQPITACPPDREQDDFSIVMSPVKWVFSRFGFHQTSLKGSVFAPEPKTLRVDIYWPKPQILCNWHKFANNWHNNAFTY